MVRDKVYNRKNSWYDINNVQLFLTLSDISSLATQNLSSGLINIPLS